MSSPIALLRRHLPMLLSAWVAALACTAYAQEPPGRVGRLNLIEGVVRASTPLAPEWAPAEYNHPLTARDRLWADRNARFELHTGATTWRLEGPGQLDVAQLDDRTTQVQLVEGALASRVRALAAGERIEIDTPNLALVVQPPADLRVDVDPQRRQTRVTLLEGSITAYGEAGQALPLSGPRQWLFEGRQLAMAAPTALPGRDGFDAWVAERNRLEDQSLSARYLPRDLIGYQPLDQHGDWSNDLTWGSVWYPRVSSRQWAPYRYGQWRWIDPWGWTWIDDAPWGFAPFHYGRWVLLGGRWAWVPGQFDRRPVYAPALVQFLGTPTVRPPRGQQRPGVNWQPLAPGELWQPAYPLSPSYQGQVNRPWDRPGRPWPATPAPALPTSPAVPIGRPALGSEPKPRPGSVEIPQVRPSPNPTPHTEAERQWREQQQREAQQQRAQELQLQAERQQQAERQRIEQQQREHMLREQQQREQLQRHQQQQAQEQAQREQWQRQQQLVQQQQWQQQREQMQREQAHREALHREQTQRQTQTPAPAVGAPAQRVGPASHPGYKGLQGDGAR